MLGLGFALQTVSYLSWTLGIYTVVHTLICFGFWVFKTYIRKPLNLEQRYGAGSWVIVTGPTSGIGEAFAVDFARLGFNIVLMGRNKEKLAMTEKYIKDLRKDIKTQIVEADFSKSMEPEFYANIYEQIKDLDISIVVNNAGVVTSNLFEQIPSQDILSMMYTNVGAPVMLTHSLLDKLRKRKQRTAVINISSLASISPSPYFGVYPATKTFVNFISHGVNLLYKKDNIDALNVIPGYVTTNMTGGRTGPDTCSAKECVKNSLASLGHDFEVAPFYVHVITAQVLHVTYRFFRPLWRLMISSEFQIKILREYYEKNEKQLMEKKDL